MFEYVVLIGNSIDGITDVIGPFVSEYEADRWIEKNPPEIGNIAKPKVLNMPTEHEI